MTEEQTEKLIEEAKARRLVQLALQRRSEQIDTRNKQQKFDDKSTIDKVRGVIGNIQEGQLLGFGDEIAGFGRAVIDPLLGAAAGEENVTDGYFDNFGDRYRMYRDDERQNTKEFADANQKTALALNLAGGLAAPVPLPVRLSKAALASKAGQQQVARQAAGRAVAEGGVAGFGMSEADLTEGEFGQAAKDTATGSAFGLGTTVGLRGAGKIANQVAKRRVAQDLVDENGRRMPLSMVDEPIGDVYRSISRLPGARGKVQALERPFVEEAAEKVYQAERALTRSRRAAEDAAADASEAATIAAQRAKSELDEQAANAVEAAQSMPKRLVKKVADKFRSDAARKSLPDEAQELLKDVDLINDVPKVRNILDDYWNNRAFQEVKKEWFDFDDTIGRKITERIKGDPDLRLHFGDEIIPKLQKMQSKLTDQFPPGTDIVPEDYIEAMLSGKYQISGDALMAMRNAFATGANGSSKNAYPLRAVAKEFDDFIIDMLEKQGKKSSADLYKKHLKQYTTALTYMDASNVKKAREAAGKFDPSTWMTQSGKYGGKRMQSRLPPEEIRARSAVEAIEGAEESGKQTMKSVRRNIKKQGQRATRDASQVRRNNARAATKAKRAIQDEAQSGALPQARAEAAALKDKLSPGGQSFISDYLVTRQAGELVPAPRGVPAPYKAAQGIGLGRVIGSNAFQDALAGQTEWQKALAKALRENDMEKYTRLLSRQAAISGSGE